MGYWSFDDAAGSLTSADAVHGSIAAAYKAGSATTDTSAVSFGNAGAFGTSAKLNGGYLQMTGNEIPVTFSCLYSGDYTINMWVNLDSFKSGSAWTPIFGDWNNPWSMMMYTNSSGTLISYVDPGSRTTLSGGTVKAGEWTMLTFTRDYAAGTISQYINGTKTAVMTADALKSKPYFAYTALQFGVKGDDKNSANGSFDESRIYSNLLSQSQLQSLYVYNDTNHVKLYLNNLIGNNSFQNALDANTTTGAIANSAGGYAVEKALNGGMTGRFNLTNDAENGVYLDLTTATALHGGLGGWSYIKNNVCGHDNTVLTAPTGYTFNGAIGMHANAMLTYDLNAIRTGFLLDDDAMMQFSTTAAMATCTSGTGAVYSLILLSSEEDGILSAWLQGEEIGVSYDEATDSWLLDLPETMPTQISRNSPIDIDFYIPSEADFLSLMMFTGTSSTSDHAMYLNASIIPSVPEPSTCVLMLLGVCGGVFCLRRKRH